MELGDGSYLRPFLVFRWWTLMVLSSIGMVVSPRDLLTRLFEGKWHGLGGWCNSNGQIGDGTTTRSD